MDCFYDACVYVVTLAAQPLEMMMLKEPMAQFISPHLDEGDGGAGGSHVSTESATNLPGVLHAYKMQACPDPDTSRNSPNKLKTLRQVYNRNMACHVIIGNGLDKQLGYATSSKEILDMMAHEHPELYRDYSETVPWDFELEQIFEADLNVSRKKIIRHFVEALVKIVGKAQKRREDAIRFIFRFDSVVSLNFDLVLPLTYSLHRQYSWELFLATTFNLIDRKTGELKSEALGMGLPKFEILETTSKEGRGEYPEGTLKAIREEGLIKYDYFYGKLRPAEGFLRSGDRLVWDEQEKRNCHYPHGTLLVYIDPADGKTCKIDLSSLETDDQMLRIIKLMGTNPLIIMDSKSERKLSTIYEHLYLQRCLESLDTMEGSLYIYGLGIDKDTDQHLWDKIDRNRRIHTVYVARGEWSEKDETRIKELLPSKDNIVIFDQELK